MKKTAIITAMKEEADHIISIYNLQQTIKLNNITIFENEDLVLVLTWIGKIQATIWTSYLFSNYKVGRLINIGIAGSLLWEDANIWDVFLVNKISQHDMYLPFEWTHLDYAKKEIVIDNNIDFDHSEFTFKIRRNAYCLTGDQFIDDWEKVKTLSEIYKADVIEMEAFAIASVAREYLSLDNCIFIKSISDGANNEAKEAHMDNLDFAMNNSIKVLQKIL